MFYIHSTQKRRVVAERAVMDEVMSEWKDGEGLMLAAACLTVSLRHVPPDVNDNVPFFTSSIYEASVTEGAEAGTLVFQVSANDLDLGLNGKVKKTKKKTAFIYLNVLDLCSASCCFSIAWICHRSSLLHRSPTRCWRIAAGTTSSSVLIQSWDSSTRR